MPNQPQMIDGMPFSSTYDGAGDPGLAAVPASSTEVAYAINRAWDPNAYDTQASQSKRGAQMQYWRMCDRTNCRKHCDRRTNINTRSAWITVGPDMSSAPLEHADYINVKHMTPMPQYGKMEYGERGAARPENRFQQLLERGGLKEMPTSQIIEYGWDKVPLVRSVRPELANFTRVLCELGGCAGRDFISEDSYRQHVQAIHSRVEGTEAMARALKNAAQIDPSAMGVAVAQAIAQIMPMLMQQASAAMATQNVAMPDTEIMYEAESIAPTRRRQ